MALEIPTKLNIRLPSIGEKEIAKLYFNLRKLENNMFAQRVRLMIGREYRRRDDEAEEPGMEVLEIPSGYEMADALAFIKVARQWRLPPRSKKFIAEVCNHAQALVEATLIMLDNNVKILAAHRRLLKNTTSHLLRASETAVMMNCSESHLKKLVDEESFPRPIRVAGKRYWVEASVQQFLQNKIEENE